MGDGIFVGSQFGARGGGCPEAVVRDAGEVDVLYIGSRVWLGDGKELSARESGEGY